MKWYEIYSHNGQYEIYEWDYNGCRYFKVFKTKKGAENWAKKQWYRVIWR